MNCCNHNFGFDFASIPEPFKISDEEKQFFLSLNNHKLSTIINNYQVTSVAICGHGYEFDSLGKQIPYKHYWGPEDGTQIYLRENPIPPKNFKIKYEYFDEGPASGFYTFSDKPQPIELATNVDDLERYQVYDSNEKTVFEFPEGFHLEICHETIYKIYDHIERSISHEKPGYSITVWKRTPRF